MATKSQQELYEIYITELQSRRPDLTDTSEGSIIDINAGVTAVAVDELQKVAQDAFRKTFFDTANGPEITGGPDELQRLAVDHFGEGFKRPQGSNATGTVTFTRPNVNAGNVTILKGTIVKTPASATGTSQRFQTVFDEVMTGLSLNASVKAVNVGESGNVQAGTVSQIEATLTDSSVKVSNAAAFSGGAGVQTDPQYRETIRTNLQTLKGATLAAIEAKAKTVGGVVLAKAVEFLQIVREWDNATDTPIGDTFKLPRVKLFIADSNGVASGALVDDVQLAVNTARAGGIRVEVVPAVALTQHWTASITLNPEGPNYGILQSDTSLITDLMRKYIQDLAIGQDFFRVTAKSFIMAAFGPSGTNDLTNFTISVPTGDVTVGNNQKLIPGTMSIV